MERHRSRVASSSLGKSIDMMLVSRSHQQTNWIEEGEKFILVKRKERVNTQDSQV